MSDTGDLTSFSLWEDHLAALEPLIQRAADSAPLHGVRKTWAVLRDRAQADAALCAEHAAKLFDPPYDPLHDNCLQNAALPALSATAFLRHAGTERKTLGVWLPPLLMAAVLGETPHTLPYHNNLHFRKVMLHAARLIGAHKEPLSAKDVALLLIAACIHDLGHDGSGNVGTDGTYAPGRLERRSVEYAAPYLRAAGLDDASLADLETMIVCTDAARPDNPACPLTQMRAAAAFHFEPERAGHQPGAGGEIFNTLKARRDLALLALFLHEADIMNSAGVSCAQTGLETTQFKQESTGDQARPSDVLEFLGTICRGGFVSQAGRTLGQDAYETIRARAQADFENGNAPYKEDSCG